MFMLVLGRKVGERIVVPQCRLTITVTAIQGNRVRLAISAPVEIDVYREEVWRQRCLQMPSTPNLASDRAGSIPSTAHQGGNQDTA
jgi:carbon storage regulator CsrA